MGRSYGPWHRKPTVNFFAVFLICGIRTGKRATTTVFVCCATCGKCGEYLVVESDGSAYPCDFYVLDNWRIGNLEKMPITEMLSSEKANAFLTWNAHKPAECAYCRYDFICNGGCKKDWFTDETGSHNYFCNAFRSLLDHALPRLKRVARAERTARQCR